MPVPEIKHASEVMSMASQESAGRGEMFLAPGRGTILLGSLLLVSVLVLNWPYRFVVVAHSSSGALRTAIDFEPNLSRPMPVLGGWPLRYWISYPATQPSRSHRWFSPLALLANLGLCAILASAAMVYAWRRQRRVLAGKLASRNVSIADLIVITLVIASPLAWWQYQDRLRSADLALQQQLLATGGAASIEGWVPEIFAKYMPVPLLQKTQRLRMARLDAPTDELVSQLAAHEHLRLLRLGGDDYDLRHLDQLATNPHIFDLRIAGRLLDARALQAIAAHSILDTLNLMRTNVSAEGLSLLDPLGELERLNLQRTDVVLEDLGTPQWSRIVRELWLPHPLPGESDRLVIDGWPNLVKLRLIEIDTTLNPAVLEVQLANLPLLEHLVLDPFQKYDLTLKSLPELPRIVVVGGYGESRLPRGGAMPKYIWASRLVASDMPKFAGTELNADDLTEVELKDLLDIKSIKISSARQSGETEVYATELQEDKLTSLIQSLGRCQGPSYIKFEHIPLQGMDLSPLAENRQIKKLLLANSGINLSQLKKLESMDWLETLDVRGCDLGTRGLQWILDSFPNLVALGFSPGGEPRNRIITHGTSLHIVDRKHLKTLALGDSPFDFFDSVRIVNSPELSLSLKMQYVQELELTGSPALTGLAIHVPPPVDAMVADLRDLTFLAVGGPTVTDQWMEAIADCRGLQRLTLAYPAVTAEGLAILANFPELTHLFLPGAPVDDSVVAQWVEMENLHVIDLSDTKITGEGLRRLTESPYLKHLAINHTLVQASDLAPLKDHVQLETLLIAGVGIDASTLASILDAGVLRQLDLSDTELTTDVLDAIIDQGSQLRYLGLQNCTIEHSKLVELVRRYPQLAFDLNGSDASTEIMSYLISQRRMIESAQWMQYDAMQRMRDEDQAPVQFVQAEVPSIIDLGSFEQYSRQTQAAMGGAGVQVGVSSATPASASQPARPLATQLGWKLGEWFGALVGRSRGEEAEITSEDEAPGEGNDERDNDTDNDTDNDAVP